MPKPHSCHTQEPTGTFSDGRHRSPAIPCSGLLSQKSRKWRRRAAAPATKPSLRLGTVRTAQGTLTARIPRRYLNTAPKQPNRTTAFLNTVHAIGPVSETPKYSCLHEDCIIKRPELNRDVLRFGLAKHRPYLRAGERNSQIFVLARILYHKIALGSMANFFKLWYRRCTLGPIIPGQNKSETVTTAYRPPAGSGCREGGSKILSRR